MAQVLDLVGLVSAAAAAWLWFRASQRRLRRLTREEELDAADINRIVVAFNRSNILNGRAALATALSALAIAVRFAANLAGLA
ncbi:MAG: hypothetical protein FJX20_03390 [Alphaproteobacteria bacterium]|nr:hypothetical protein [Alphaproteobacteria bacterium]